MDRLIVYPGAIPLDTDILSSQRNAMIALGSLAQAMLGTSTVVDGLACTQTTVASMSVLVAPGSLFTLSNVDATAFGSLAADTTDALVKFGTNLTSTTLTMTAPVSAGQSINYLIEAAFLEADGTSVVLPYYNAANPASPYSGPSGGGAAQNTLRTQRVQLQLKAGTAAATGSQTTPAVDAGWVGLYAVTVAFAQTTITAPNIATLAAAPFIPAKLGVGTVPGFSRVQSFTSGGTFTAPAGVTKVKVTVVGGGGGGGGNAVNQGAAGGSAGGTSIRFCTVTPGQAVTVTVGASGSGGSSVGPAAGGTGGTSSFGAFCTATGGSGGSASSGTNSAGSASGVGASGDINLSGGHGMDGQTLSSSLSFGGTGGASLLGGGGRGGSGGGLSGQAPGSGGGGSYSTSGNGGSGASGIVIVEY